LFLPDLSGWELWYGVQALFVGMFASFMLHNQRIYKEESDEQRKTVLELERLKLELLEASQSAAREAELLERNRIARQLHDHLGHDLTGASLALQAYDYVRDPEKAREVLEEVKARLQ